MRSDSMSAQKPTGLCCSGYFAFFLALNHNQRGRLRMEFRSNVHSKSHNALKNAILRYWFSKYSGLGQDFGGKAFLPFIFGGNSAEGTPRLGDMFLYIWSPQLGGVTKNVNNSRRPATKWTILHKHYFIFWGPHIRYKTRQFSHMLHFTSIAFQPPFVSPPQLEVVLKTHNGTMLRNVLE